MTNRLTADNSSTIPGCGLTFDTTLKNKSFPKNLPPDEIGPTCRVFISSSSLHFDSILALSHH